MRIWTMVLALLALLLPAIGQAQDWTRGEFDARYLNAQEKRVVQAALVLSGDYVGFLDGDWGKGSQAALERYTHRVFGSDKPTFDQLRPLLTAFETEWEADGWAITYSNAQNISYAHPFFLLSGPQKDPADPGKLTFGSSDQGLSLYIYFHTVQEAIGFHDYAMAKAQSDPQRYSSASADRLITSFTYPNGTVAYIRSNRSGADAVTYSIMGSDGYRVIVALMASSMQHGNGADLGMPPGSSLAALLDAPPQETARKTEDAAQVAAQPATPSGAIASTGTGFFVNTADLVTAAHVIEGCGSLQLADGAALSVVKVDAVLDLAVLNAAEPSAHWLLLSPETTPHLGEAVMALGYPYLGTLGQGQTVTSGNVSALQGIDGARDRIMISAPVQPGNSGGPLLDGTGAAIGVVVARVDDLKMLETTGTLPQNMNFAVPNAPLTAFLTGAGVMFSTEATGADLRNGVPKAVTAATVPIYCMN